MAKNRPKHNIPLHSVAPRTDEFLARIGGEDIREQLEKLKNFTRTLENLLDNQARPATKAMPADDQQAIAIAEAKSIIGKVSARAVETAIHKLASEGELDLQFDLPPAFVESMTVRLDFHFNEWAENNTYRA